MGSVRPGDVAVTPAGDGWLCFQYLGSHPEYGDSVRVCPLVQLVQPTVCERLFEAAYVVFYPARAAVARSLARVIGHLPSPGVPTRVRRPGVREGRVVRTWIIEDESGERVTAVLSDQDLALPIAVIWNQALLVQRVTEGWKPEQEGRSDS
jgi:hypothetical protein